MMKKTFTSLVLALALQLSTVATAANSKFSCAKTTSDVAVACDKQGTRCGFEWQKSLLLLHDLRHGRPKYSGP